MSTDPSALAVVQEVFRCFAAQDVPGLMAVLDEEIEWHEPDVDVPWRGIHRGHDGFTSSAGSWLIWSSKLMNSSPPTTRSRRLVRRARVTATGRTYHSDFAFVFRVRNGK